MTSDERKAALEHLVAQYEELLHDIVKVGPTFEVERLPQVIQDSIALVTAKAPGFSNIAAVTVSNFTYSHLISQMRIRINDQVYSPDTLGLGSFSILLSPSGSGKSSSANALNRVCHTANTLIEGRRKQEATERAKERALHEVRKDKPDAQLEDLTFQDYGPFLKELTPTNMNGSQTTVGGISSTSARLAKESLGSLAVIMDEFSLDLKQGKSTAEVLQVLAELFDNGNYTVGAFKTEELRETNVEDTFPNFLGHSSPALLFKDQKVRETLEGLLLTALARRCWFSFPDEIETIENDIVPEISPDAIRVSREQATTRRELLSRKSVELETQMGEVVRRLLAGAETHTIRFTEPAAELYSDYFEYCFRRSKLLEDSSLQQVEIGSRAFRVGRLAAVWSLCELEFEITKPNLEAAIYYAEYNSKYLDRFVQLTSSKPFVLLAELFTSGKVDHITLDNAISSGYIARVSNDFRELIDPLNSYIRDTGVCKYNTDTKTFEYTAFKVAEELGEGFTLSYTKVHGMTKDDRAAHLDSFKSVRDNVSLATVAKLMAQDAIYNVFKYKEAFSEKEQAVVPNNRAQENVISESKLVCIDVDKSEVPLHTIHEYLEEYQHIVCTTSDPENKYKFRIVLPVNVAISATDPALYRYICKRLSADLLITPDVSGFTFSQPMYSYFNSEVLLTDKGLLYDITEYITEFTVEAELPKAKLFTKSKTPTARKTKVQKLLNNVNEEFGYALNPPEGEGSFTLAKLSMHCRDEEMTANEYRVVLDYVVSVWPSPFPADRLDKMYEQWAPQMEQG